MKIIEKRCYYHDYRNMILSNKQFFKIRPCGISVYWKPVCQHCAICTRGNFLCVCVCFCGNVLLKKRICSARRKPFSFRVQNGDKKKSRIAYPGNVHDSLKSLRTTRKISVHINQHIQDLGLRVDILMKSLPDQRFKIQYTIVQNRPLNLKHFQL